MSIGEVEIRGHMNGFGQGAQAADRALASMGIYVFDEAFLYDQSIRSYPAAASSAARRCGARCRSPTCA